MQSTEEIQVRILKLLAKNPTSRFTTKEIAQRLSITNRKELRLLRKTLGRLSTSQQIIREGRKHFRHFTQSTTQRLIGIFSIINQREGRVRLFPPNEGVVTIKSHFRGTALDGDTVSVALLAKSSTLLKGQKKLEGEVIEIIERSNRPIVGTFQKSKNFSFVVPDDPRIGRDIYIAKGKTKNARIGDKVVAIIDSWVSPHLNPEGHVKEILGTSGELHTEIISVIRQFQLPTSFPKEVLTESENIKTTIDKSEYNKRYDFRDTTCFTIDPETAKDYDDAVSLELLPNGNFNLGVHIADVSHYVKENTLIDREAMKRGTSVYLADTVIPMLPEKLSNSICSLIPFEDRLTYSVIMTISPKGTIRDYNIVKSIINSKKRFTYEEVQKIIETGRGEFAKTILLMNKLSKILLKKRLQEGSIDFETTEVVFRFDELGKPTDIIKKLRLDSHSIIEEFMLITNHVVSKHIGKIKNKNNQMPFIYRVHDKPDPEKLKDFITFINHLGYKLDFKNDITPATIQKLLNQVKGTEEENVINEIAIRSMAKAFYSEKNIGHFGLGFRYYTHFTSPIRRYPDLIVHRLLNEYENNISANRKQHLTTILPNICELSSERERIAMEAERTSVKVLQIEYMKRHLGDEFNAIISGVTNFGLFVKISDLLVEGLVRVRDMNDDFYIFNEKQYALIGSHNKRRYRLGDKVIVKVIRVDPEEREIDFILVD